MRHPKTNLFTHYHSVIFSIPTPWGTTPWLLVTNQSRVIQRLSRREPVSTPPGTRRLGHRDEATTVTFQLNIPTKTRPCRTKVMSWSSLYPKMESPQHSHPASPRGFLASRHTPTTSTRKKITYFSSNPVQYLPFAISPCRLSKSLAGYKVHYVLSPLGIGKNSGHKSCTFALVCLLWGYGKNSVTNGIWEEQRQTDKCNWEIEEKAREI